MVALKEFSKAQSRSKKAQPAVRYISCPLPDAMMSYTGSAGLQLLHPFQTIDFLVRDWQNFQDDSDIKRSVSKALHSLPFETCLILYWSSCSCMDEMPIALEDALNSNIKVGCTASLHSAVVLLRVILTVWCCGICM